MGFSRILENTVKDKGFHIALTGGLLYKDGERKDCDIVVYRVRQEKNDPSLFFETASKIGLKVVKSYGFCTKCEFFGKGVDILYPEYSEESGNQYPIQTDSLL